MSLSDIREKLYKKEPEKDLAKHEESNYDPHIANMPSQSAPGAPDLWLEKKKGFGETERKAVKYGLRILGGLVILLLLTGAGYLIEKSAFSQSKITVVVNGQGKIASGKFVTYEIDFQNNNRADLQNAVLDISYPEDFKPESNPNFKENSPLDSSINLGTIKGYDKGKVVFNGRVYTPKGALMYLKAGIKYNPSGSSSQFIASGQLGISVDSSPVSVEVLAPQNVASGDEVGYLINYSNDGESKIQGLKIMVDYPNGFTFSSSDPKVSEGNNTWYIGDLDAGQSGKIVASGKLEGGRDQSRKVAVHIGTAQGTNFVSLDDSDATTTITASPLAIAQTVNGSANLNVNAGENLNFTINYRNDGVIGLRDVIVKETIDSPVVDYKSLDAQGGSFDAASKTVTWKASDHPTLQNLQPGQSGTIGFSIKIKDAIPMNNANDKNYVVSSIVKIDSPDIPTPISMNKIIAGNVMNMRLNSKLLLNVTGYHRDPNITNSGPVPPKVGQDTTYTIHWIASDVSNDVSNATVDATLPTGVTMTGAVYPEGSRVTYDERSNSILWEIGNMGAGTGILSAPQEVSFQIKVTPSPNQAGKEIDLLKPSVFTAQDLFTGEKLSANAQGKNTSLPEDNSLYGAYIVQP